MGAVTDSPGPEWKTLSERLESVGQSHLLRFADELDAAARRVLIDEVSGIDFEQIGRLWERSQQRPEEDDLAVSGGTLSFEPPPTCSWEPDDWQLKEAGEAALRAGQVGVLLVAGGQGTRLGFPHPKGLFPLGPLSQRTLFQILVDRIRAVRARYGASLPLWILTSRATDAATRAYFSRHDYLGLPAEDVIFFQQGSMPAVDARTGKVLLESKGHVALSPNGHGGVLAAWRDSGELHAAAERGVQTIFYGQVDNPLLPIADPALIGRHRLEQCDVTSLAVEKRSPDERVGLFMQTGGHIHVIEYSDLPDALAHARDPDGRLRYRSGSIAVHLFDRSFLERQATAADALPYHAARKKVPYIDASGKRIEPEEPNAIKFERFIFDLLPHARRALVVDVPREETFAPVKNAEGAAADSPSTSRAAIVAQARRWLEAAGARVDPAALVEINPCWALDTEEVARRIEPGRVIATDTYFAP